MKDSLNKNYNFVSKFVTLEDQEDSVNFDEIIAVAPPPIGINCSYNVETEELRAQNMQIRSWLVLENSTGIFPCFSWFPFISWSEWYFQMFSTCCVARWRPAARPSSTLPTRRSKTTPTPTPTTLLGLSPNVQKLLVSKWAIFPQICNKNKKIQRHTQLDLTPVKSQSCNPINK